MLLNGAKTPWSSNAASTTTHDEQHDSMAKATCLEAADPVTYRLSFSGTLAGRCASCSHLPL